MLNVYLAHTNFRFGQLVVLGKKPLFGWKYCKPTRTRTRLPARYVDHPGTCTAFPLFRDFVLLRRVRFCDAGVTGHSRTNIRFLKPSPY